MHAWSVGTRSTDRRVAPISATPTQWQGIHTIISPTLHVEISLYLCQTTHTFDREVITVTTTARYIGFRSTYSQIPNLIQMTQWQGTKLHLQNDTPIQIRRYSLRASKVTQTMKVKEIKHNTFGKRARASGLEFLASEFLASSRWNWSFPAKLKDSSFSPIS